MISVRFQPGLGEYPRSPTAAIYYNNRHFTGTLTSRTPTMMEYHIPIVCTSQTPSRSAPAYGNDKSRIAFSHLAIRLSGICDRSISTRLCLPRPPPFDFIPLFHCIHYFVVDTTFLYLLFMVGSFTNFSPSQYCTPCRSSSKYCSSSFFVTIPSFSRRR